MSVLSREEFVKTMALVLIKFIKDDPMFMMFFVSGMQIAGIERSPQNVSIIMKEILDKLGDQLVEEGMKMPVAAPEQRFPF